MTLVLVLMSMHHPHHRPHHGYPAWWRREASCIRWHESRGQWHIQTGNGYYGAYQFLWSTWASVALHGWPADPAEASPAVQTFGAWRVWVRDGRSWREWSTRVVCGVR